MVLRTISGKESPTIALLLKLHSFVLLRSVVILNAAKFTGAKVFTSFTEQ